MRFVVASFSNPAANSDFVTHAVKAMLTLDDLHYPTASVEDAY